MDVSMGSPSTFVQVDSPKWTLPLRRPQDRSLDRRVAALLGAVLLAAAEQVSHEKLAAFGVSRALDLPMLGLAMAFRDDDTGLVGDVFEWSVLLAANGADDEVSSMLSDALTLLGIRVDRPQAVLVAAEPGRLVEFSPELAPRASLATGRRGRPPHVTKLLHDADTQSWKADLLVGAEDRWVATSLKSNPRALQRSLREAAGTPHPPRIGVTAAPASSSGVFRDRASGAVIVKVPVDLRYLSLSKAVLADVRTSFDRHLSVSETPLQQDVSGIGHQLHRWRDRTVSEVLRFLLELAMTC